MAKTIKSMQLRPADAELIFKTAIVQCKKDGSYACYTDSNHVETLALLRKTFPSVFKKFIKEHACDR